MCPQDTYEAAYLDAVRRAEQSIAETANAFRTAVRSARRAHTRTRNQVGGADQCVS